MDSSGFLVYLHDGSLDGFLTAVFDAYQNRELPRRIRAEENAPVLLEGEERLIVTDPEKARRVETGLAGKLGHPFLQKLWVVFLSCDPDKDTLLYRYIRRGLSLGRLVYNDLAHPDVAPVENLYRNIGSERQHLLGFARFSLLEGGVYFARISPKNALVPLLMPHFADRFSSQPFLLQDVAHGQVGVYDRKEWWMVGTRNLSLPDTAPEEADFRRLWKLFYDTVAIKERVNPVLRRSLMPRRFWPDLTEMNFTGTHAVSKAENGISAAGPAVFLRNPEDAGAEDGESAPAP